MHTETLEGEWDAFSDILARKDGAIQVFGLGSFLLCFYQRKWCVFENKKRIGLNP